MDLALLSREYRAKGTFAASKNYYYLQDEASCAGMASTAQQFHRWKRAAFLLAIFGLLSAVTSQEVHTRGLVRGAILEPAHYHSDTTSASTREEDLAQHVQADVNTSFTANPAQETPHTLSKSAVQSSVVEDTTYQMDTTTKQHWGEKNASLSTISGTLVPLNSKSPIG